MSRTVFHALLYAAGAALALLGGVLALMAAGNGPLADEPGAGLALFFAGVAIIGTVAALPDSRSAAEQDQTHAYVRRSRGEADRAWKKRKPWEEPAE